MVDIEDVDSDLQVLLQHKLYHIEVKVIMVVINCIVLVE